MKKLLLLLALVTVAFVDVKAQMTDDQVIEYAKEQNASGASQKQIAAGLLSKGVTQDQILRIKEKYESANSSTVTTSGTADLSRDRVNNGQLLPDVTDFEEEPTKKIFGHDIFRNQGLSFESSMNVATPTDYALGPGDEIILDIYGASQMNEKFKVAPDGTITIPNEGPVAVSGLTLTQAQNKVRKAIGGHYQGSSIKLSVGQTRTVMVNVMGEVKTPGTYTMSAFATVFNALYLAGGVNDIGTLRNIKVSRKGRIVTTVDVYDYILNGRLAGNVTLKDNDVIIVGPYENLVEAQGNVKRPMFYEMKKDESLQSLLKYTGGFTGDAYKQKVRIERKSDEGLTVYNVDEFDFSNFTMEDGDVALVDSAIARAKNTLTITGAVFRPGSYKLGGNVNSVRTLVEQAGGLVENANSTRAVLHRMKEDRTLQTMTINLASILSGKAPDVVLQNEDELIINSNEELNKARKLTIYGDVFKPGDYEYSEGETVEDLITEAGGLKESASLNNVEVARRIISSSDSEDGMKTATIYNLTLQDGLAIEGETGVALRPYDVVTIRKSPDYATQQRVFISGEIKYEGSYIMSNKQERLSEIVKRAGGTTSTAYTEGAQLIRRYSQKDKELQLRKLEVAQTKADSIAIMNNADKMTYNVGIDLEKAVANPGSSYDVVLQENDSIYIPKLNNTVKVSGEVLFPNTVAYTQGKSVSYYINQAGGVSENSKKRLAYIVYPNGQVSKASKGKVQPGCEIVVPMKVEKKVDTTRTSMYLAITTTIATIASVLITALK